VRAILLYKTFTQANPLFLPPNKLHLFSFTQYMFPLVQLVTQCLWKHYVCNPGPTFSDSCTAW